MTGYIVTAHFLTKAGQDRKLTHHFPHSKTRASAEANAANFFGRPTRSIYKMDIVEA